ncbi:MAG: hypothetical protein ACJA1R_003175 [Flavobacteriales bacterium]|jgi:hypothetical protein
MRPLPYLFASAMLVSLVATPDTASAGHIRLTVDVRQAQWIPQNAAQLQRALDAAGLSVAFLAPESYDAASRVTSIGGSVMRGQWEEVGVSIHVCDDDAACDAFTLQMQSIPQVVVLRDPQTVLVVSDWNPGASRAAEYAERIQQANW